jgi:hypothetical protein
LNTRRRTYLIMALLVAAPSGCASDALVQPALISAPSPAGLAELETSIAALLGARVTLAADTFTASSEVVVERSPSMTRMQGRILGPPERFLLRKRGTDCFVIREADGKEARLTVNRCISPK